MQSASFVASSIPSGMIRVRTLAPAATDHLRHCRATIVKL